MEKNKEKNILMAQTMPDTSFAIVWAIFVVAIIPKPLLHFKTLK